MIAPMPTIAHSIVGGALGLVLLTWSKEARRVFTPPLVILFALNSFIGPDLFHIPVIVLGAGHDSAFGVIDRFVHSLVGFVIWAGPVAAASYLVVNARRDKGTRTPPLSIYLTVVAGGICHFALDLIDNGVRLLPLGTRYLRLTDLQTGRLYPSGPLEAALPWFSMSELLVMGVACMVLLVYLLVRKGERAGYAGAGVFLAIIAALLLLFGGQLVGGEHDLGYGAYGLLFWVAPIMLCYGAALPREHPAVAPSFRHWAHPPRGNGSDFTKKGESRENQS